MNYLNKFIKTIFLIAVVAIFTVSTIVAQPKEEVRAVWLTTLFGIDWPKTSSRDIQKQDLIVILDKLKAANFNTVMFQVRARGDLTYYSEIEPYSKAITGVLGKDPGYDVLKFVIDECHKRGMEVHAWFVTFNALNGSTKPVSTTPEHVVNAHPEYVVNYNNLYFWLDPGLPEVREYVKSIVVEIVNNYEVDGIHFDYIRYPGTDFNDAASYALYGNGQTRDNWRRENINKFVYSVYDYITENKLNVKVGAAPIGIYKNTPQFTGWQAYYDIYQDSRDWLEKGKADYLCPMIYWDIASNPKFPLVVKDWTDNDFGKHIYPGIGSYRMAPAKRDSIFDGIDGMEFIAKYGKRNDWPSDEIINQIYASRENAGLGQTYFSSITITQNYKQIHDKMLAGPYKYPANIPSMSWRDNIKPNAPQNVKIQKHGVSRGVQYLISWDAPAAASDGDGAKYYNVYAGATPNIDLTDIKNVVAFKVMNQTETIISFDAEPTQNLYYVVTAYDKGYNESDASTVVSLDNSLAGLYPTQPDNESQNLFVDVRLYWSKPVENTIYSLQLATDANFTNIVKEVNNISDNSYLMSRLEADTKYFWRIKMQTSDKWTYSWWFTTKPAALLTEWEISLIENNLPTWFDTNAEIKSIAAWGNKLYVLNKTANTIKAYNSESLEVANDVNVATHQFNIIEATSDGILFGSTYSANVSTQNFNVVKWTSDTDAPVVLIDYQGTESIPLGSAIDIKKGTLANQYIIAAVSHTSGKIFKWTYTNGVLSQATVIQVQGVSSFVDNTKIEMLGDGFLINTTANTIAYVGANGNILANIPQTLINGNVYALSTTKFEGRDFILFSEDIQITDAKKGHLLKVLDITNGIANLTHENIYDITVSIGETQSIFSDIAVLNAQQIKIFLLSAHNGIVAYRTSQIAPVASNVAINGTAEVGIALNGTYLYADQNSDTEGSSIYKWYMADNISGLNATQIEGENATQFILKYPQEGKFIAFEVTPVATSGITNGVATRSPFVGPVVATTARAPKASNLYMSGNSIVNTRLIGYYTYSDANNDAEGTSLYQWYRATLADGSDAVAISGAYGISRLVKSEDVGYYLLFEVTPVSKTSTLADSLVGKPVRSLTTGPAVLTSGLEDVAGIDVDIYPNPASSFVDIRLENSTMQNIEVIIRNTLGQIIRTSVFSSSNLIRMNLENIEAGYYLIEIKSDKQLIFNDKLIIR